MSFVSNIKQILKSFSFRGQINVKCPPPPPLTPTTSYWWDVEGGFNKYNEI